MQVYFIVVVCIHSFPNRSVPINPKLTTAIIDLLLLTKYIYGSMVQSILGLCVYVSGFRAHVMGIFMYIPK